MTKKELENELKLYKAMYEKTHEERMEYLFLLESISNHCFYCALQELDEIKAKEFTFSKSLDGFYAKELELLLRYLARTFKSKNVGGNPAKEV